MAQALAAFTACDGTGLWEVHPWGITVNTSTYRFTDHSHITCSGCPGHSLHTIEEVPSRDGFGLWAAWAVLQETGSLKNAALTLFALGSTTSNLVHRDQTVPGSLYLAIGGLDNGRGADERLCYRESGQSVQVEAVQRFADAALAAIRAFRGIRP